MCDLHILRYCSTAWLYFLPRRSRYINTFVHDDHCEVKKSPQRQKRWSVVTSRRRAPDAALVLDYLITHDARFLCDRDTVPACAHVVQSICLQVQCGVHTNTATSMSGLAQLSTKEDTRQFGNAGDIDSASSTQRMT